MGKWVYPQSVPPAVSVPASVPVPTSVLPPSGEFKGATPGGPPGGLSGSPVPRCQHLLGQAARNGIHRPHTDI